MLCSGYSVNTTVRRSESELQVAEMPRVSSIRAAVAKMARVLRWRLIDVIHVEIATVTHLNIDGPSAAVAPPAEACLPGDLTFVHCGMSTV